MIEILGIYILRPWWLAAIPMIGIAAYFVLVRNKNYGGWQKVITPELLSYLQERGSLSMSKSYGFWPYVLFAALILSLSLADPASKGSKMRSLQNRDIVFIVIDISNSILESGSIQSAQNIAASILDIGSDRPIAMAVYGGETYLVRGPGLSAEKLETAISVLDQNVMPDAGSRPELALEFAREVLQQAQYPSGEVLLISDGGGIDPNAEHQARFLAEEGYQLSTIYVTPAQVTPGLPESNPSGLANLAKIGQGRAFHDDEINDVGKYLQAQGGLREASIMPSLYFRSYGRYFLVLALFAMIPVFRKRGGQ